MDKLPKLDNEVGDQALLTWILMISRHIINLEVMKASEVIYERVWRAMPRVLIGKLPARHESLVVDQLSQDSPYKLIEIFISRAQRMIEPSIAAMKITANELVNADFWKFATHIRDMIIIEDLRNYFLTTVDSKTGFSGNHQDADHGSTEPGRRTTSTYSQ
jgi:hypothetical protein